MSSRCPLSESQMMIHMKTSDILMMQTVYPVETEKQKTLKAVLSL